MLRTDDLNLRSKNLSSLAENLELEVWWKEPRNPSFVQALMFTGCVSLDKSSLLLLVSSSVNEGAQRDF